ncbi:MAG: N-6 DNA methylase [Methyloprofundus sp.]|nr:N-6 DNA methylase [Methyloprofundus sp.]
MSTYFLESTQIKAIVKTLEAHYTTDEAIKVLMSLLLVVKFYPSSLDLIIDDKTGLNLDELSKSIHTLTIKELHTLNISKAYKPGLEQALIQLKTEIGAKPIELDGVKQTQSLREYLISQDSKYKLELSNDKLNTLMGAILLKYLNLKDDENIYDGCAKTGEIFSWVKQVRSTKLYLEEKNTLSFTLAQAFAQMEGHQENNYGATKFFQNSALDNTSLLAQECDFYVSNPYHPYPLSAQQQTIEHPYLLNIFMGRSNINRNSADALWIQLALHSTKKFGKIVIVVQEKFLSRPGYDKTLREYLTKNNLLDTIVFLPANLSPSTQSLQCILVLDKTRKQLTHVNRIKMIDIRSFGSNSNGYWLNNELSDFDTALMEDTSECSHIIGQDQIIGADFNWHIEQYLDKTEDLPSVNEAEKMFFESVVNLKKILKTCSL